MYAYLSACLLFLRLSISCSYDAEAFVVVPFMEKISSFPLRCHVFQHHLLKKFEFPENEIYQITNKGTMRSMS